MTYIPYESTILQGKYGYSNLFRMYQTLNVGVAFSQNDVPDLFEGHNKKVSQVYEYWCFIKLYYCLFGLSDNKPSLEPVIGDRGKQISIRSGKPITFNVSLNGFGFNIQLYYNKSFDQNSLLFKSYSLRLRPDFTLVIDFDNRRYIINFDAKYKVAIKKPEDAELDDSKISNGCWEYDIYKMHTYRDALIKSLGSYVLYPGNKDEDETWERYIKPLSEDEWDDRQSKVLPSVGAVSLTPGSNSENQLRNAIVMILERIAKISGTLKIDQIIR